MTNFEIQRMLKHVKGFVGVYCKDELPAHPKKGESMVVNLQDANDGGGTHWVALVNEADYEYFDPFGIYPPDVVVEYMKKTDGAVYNTWKIQDVSSIMCGYYCCYYILERASGRSANDVLLDFDQDSTENETKLRKYFS